MKKKNCEVKIHKFLDCACKSQDFVQSQKNFARSHDHETVTFRNLPVTCHVSCVTCRMSVSHEKYHYFFFFP